MSKRAGTNIIPEQKQVYTVERNKKTAERIKELREEKGLTQIGLSDELRNKYDKGISPDTVKYFEINDVYHSKFMKKAGMSITSLVNMADYFGVTADYLLGLTDNKTPDANIQSAIEATGLTDNAIVTLNDDYKYTPQGKFELDILSHLIENGKMKEVLKHFRVLATAAHMESIIKMEIYDTFSESTEHNFLKIMSEIYYDIYSEAADRFLEQSKEMLEIEKDDRIAKMRALKMKLESTIARFREGKIDNINDTMRNNYNAALVRAKIRKEEEKK